MDGWMMHARGRREDLERVPQRKNERKRVPLPSPRRGTGNGFGPNGEWATKRSATPDSFLAYDPAMFVGSSPECMK